MENVVTQSCPDGAVTVSVNHGGELVSLSLGPAADRVPPPRLANLIMATYREAAARARNAIGPVRGDPGAAGSAPRTVPMAIPLPPHTPVDEPLPDEDVAAPFRAPAPRAAGRHPAKPSTPAPRPTRRRHAGGPDEGDDYGDSYRVGR